MQKKILFIIAIGLALIVQTVAAEKLVQLRDGSKIYVQGTWEEEGKLKYFKDGKIYSVPKETVLQIRDMGTPENKRLKKRESDDVTYIIHMLDGRQFKTKLMEMDETTLSYERFGVFVSFDKSKVKEIIEQTDTGEQTVIFENDSQTQASGMAKRDVSDSLRNIANASQQRAEKIQDRSDQSYSSSSREQSWKRLDCGQDCVTIENQCKDYCKMPFKGLMNDAYTQANRNHIRPCVARCVDKYKECLENCQSK